jgi:hypothetical protein
MIDNRSPVCLVDADKGQSRLATSLNRTAALVPTYTTHVLSSIRKLDRTFSGRWFWKLARSGDHALLQS